MIYVYHCLACDTLTDVIKPLSHIDEDEPCQVCAKLMQRTVSWKGEMKLGDIGFKPDYYPAFGKTFTNPTQLRDEIKKQKYEHGVDLVEVGNQRLTPTQSKPSINWDEAGYALNKELRKRRGF